jgi:predicted CoA-substrate-specific enzyme activase
MITAGVDIGSTASKAVILDDNRVISSVIGPSEVNPAKTAKKIYEPALDQAGVKGEDVEYILGTGYGRAQVPFANTNVSELSCHGRGAHYYLADVRTVIDIGGQDTKAVSIDSKGNLIDFVMNDKCAAGTGRFLENMARSMGLQVGELENYHFQDGEPSMITSLCSVFAESEVINLLNEGVSLPRIIKGIHISLANRVMALARRLGIEPEVTVTGGVAKSRAVIDALEKKLNMEVAHLPEGVDPQIIGAVGAALIACDHARKKDASKPSQG